jgi:hypothetical protein
VCQVKKAPLNRVRYSNNHFGNYVDLCLVDLIADLNNRPNFSTVASCCGHGKDIPYITVIQPKSMISTVKEMIKTHMGWTPIATFIWNDMPPDACQQLGADFLQDKVYVGYYNHKSKEITLVHGDYEVALREAR